MAAATWARVADGFAKTAETAPHFVGALNRSPAHPAKVRANNMAMVLILAVYANSEVLSEFSLDEAALPKAPG